MNANMDWNKLLMDIMFTVITIILPLITKYVVAFINTKIAEHTVNMEDENMKKYIQAATDAVTLAVVTVQQTYTDSMKMSGKFDKEAANVAKQLAVEKANSIITTESKKYIEMLYGDFQSWIDQSVEAMVRQTKLLHSEKVDCVDGIENDSVDDVDNVSDIEVNVIE